jgi:hypothetical protein
MNDAFEWFGCSKARAVRHTAEVDSSSEVRAA